MIFFTPALPEQGDVFLRQLVEDILVAEPAQAVAAAQLVLAENPPGEAGLVEQGRQGHGDMLVAGVEGAGAADEEEIFGLPGHERALAELAAPLGALGRGDPPGVAALLHVLEEVEQLLGELRLALHQVAAHLDDLAACAR